MGKKLLVILLALTLILSLSSCAKVAEKAVEKAISNSTGGKVDVNTKDGSVSVKDDQGNTATLGGTKWPTSAIGKLIPEFKDGTITYVIDAATGASITIEKVTKNEYESYLAKVKTAGFDKDSLNSSSEDSMWYSASDKNGNGVALSFSIEDETMTIILSAKSN